ncbi:YncE family protein [Flavobacterium adhaerens]|uniref:YncE family protein n=1 Tax=Flavobacterium adhaerens TaxID=3149043 RepID=UPI0032B4C32C
MKICKLVLMVVTSTLFFVSCTNDDDTKNEPLGSYDKGFLILNQGGFGHNDASVSYVSSDFDTSQNDIFSVVNPNITLGDTGQDIGFNGENAYIVLNASNKIEIVNRYTMQSLGSINTGLKNPRYIAFANGKGYVTNWGDGGVKTDDYVAVIDLSTNKVTSSIPVAEGPEKILENSGKLYVAHKGGYGYGNSLSVINASSNSVVTTITVGEVPESMGVKGSTLWVACSGNPSYVSAPLVETPGKIVKVDLSTNTVTSTIAYTDATKHITNLVLGGNDAYYTVDADIFKLNDTTTSLPTNALFSTTPQGVYGIYSFAVHGNYIYVGDAGDYSTNGKVYVYGLVSPSVGTLEKTFTVGVIPAGFYFND